MKAELSFRTSVVDGPGEDIGQFLRNQVERIEPVRCSCRSGFDLEGAGAADVLIEQAALKTAVVPENGQIGPAAPIETALERFYYDCLLEQRPANRAGANLSGAFDSDEVACQADIVEIELRSLDQPFTVFVRNGGSRKTTELASSTVSQWLAAAWDTPASAPKDDKLASCPTRPAHRRTNRRKLARSRIRG